MLVDINDDAIYPIVLNELKTIRSYLAQDLLRDNPNVFFFNEPEKDRLEIQKHIDAMDIVIDWYSIPSVENVLSDPE